MERKMKIEEHVDVAMQSVKGMESSELPYGFSERVVGKLRLQNRNNVRSLYTFSPLLKIAAVFILILINMVTLRLVMGTQQVVQNTSQPQFITLNDFVNDYQINDTNEELITSNTPAHE